MKIKSNLSHLFVIGVFCVITFTSVNTCYSQPGTLDNSFDLDGKVITPIGAADDRITEIAVQADGKILAVGFSDNGTDHDFVLVRYNTDGSLDNTFDLDGKVITDFSGGNDHAASLVIQSDGKILVVGESSYDVALARYNTDGSMDNSFSGDGMLTTDFAASFDAGYCIAVQSDGKILVAGDSNGDFALARYTSTGSLDNSFSSDGMQTTDFGSATDGAAAIAIQPDGKIVLAGYTNGGVYYAFALARYTSTGNLDNTFDTDGMIITAVGTDDDFGWDMKLQADGKIVVVGQSDVFSGSDVAIVRYNTDGTLDNSFDSDGKLMTDFGATDGGISVYIQSDGKILMGGRSDGDFIVGRYNSNGTLDNTFDSDGKVTTSVGPDNDEGISICLQADGKILLGGFSGSGFDNDFALVRYFGDLVGLSDPLAQNSIAVYPNPTSGMLNVTNSVATEALSFRLLNLTGQVLLYNQNMKPNDMVLDISEQPAGIYFLEFYTSSEASRIKIVKR
jgi:uncharacterized delta-60 repeat protein